MKHHIRLTHLCDSSLHASHSWTLTVITTDKESRRREEGKGRTLVDSSYKPEELGGPYGSGHRINLSVTLPVEQRLWI